MLTNKMRAICRVIFPVLLVLSFTGLFFILIDLGSYSNSYSDLDETVYSDIVFSSSTENVKSVMVDGNWLVKNRESQVYDQKEIIAKGKEELNQLLKRVK